MNRRTFMKTGTAAAPLLGSAAQLKTTSPSGRVGVALIGCGGMGRMDLSDFLRTDEVDVVAVCDVYKPNLERARQAAGGKAEAYGDYRRALDRKEVDAVIIATPDHWHALMTVDACNAGKDVYVEKPVSFCVREGRLMVEAARRNKRVVQVGLQQRSGTHFQRAVKAVRDGRIGAVRFAQCWNHYAGGTEGMGFPKDEPAPADLDWDAFLGPAPKVPYNPARRNFRAFRDYAGGELTNWGTHLIDVVHWAMDVKGPASVAGSGGIYHIKDCRDVEDTVDVIYEYPGFLMRYSTMMHNSFGPNGHPGNKPFGSYGIMFQGTLGTLFVDRAGYEIIPQMQGKSETVSQSFREAFDDLSGIGLYFTTETTAERGTSSLQHYPHVKNFIECVKTRQAPAADIEIGHRSTVPCLLGNIALRTGVKLQWDADAEKITNSVEADAMLTRKYRAPWRMEGL